MKKNFLHLRLQYIIVLFFLLPVITLSGNCAKPQYESPAISSVTPEQYFERGIIYSQAGRYEQAIDDFTKAIELDPDDVEPYYLRSKVYPYVGLWDKSIEDCSTVIMMDPFNTGAFYMRGIAYMESGNYSNALDDLQRASEYGIDDDERGELDKIAGIAVPPGGLVLLDATYSSLGGTGCRGQYIGYNNTLHVYIFVNAGEGSIEIDRISISPPVDDKSDLKSPVKYISNSGVRQLVICISSESRIVNNISCTLYFRPEGAASFKMSNEITGKSM
jgi:tetratricopeptide (TPR) repeat protein